MRSKDFTLHTTRQGERTTTPAQNRRVKEEQGFKCAHCSRKFPEWQLQVHHKKGVHKHKSPYSVDLPVISMGEKIKPRYDRRSNLEAICIPCHNKTKSKKGKAELRKKTKKRKNKTTTKKATRKTRQSFGTMKTPNWNTGLTDL